jgi:hypothetical protein
LHFLFDNESKFISPFLSLASNYFIIISLGLKTLKSSSKKKEMVRYGAAEKYGFNACYELTETNPTEPVHQPDCVAFFALCKYIT